MTSSPASPPAESELMALRIDERRLLEIRAQHERETGTGKEDTSEYQDVRCLLRIIDRRPASQPAARRGEH